MKTSKLQKLAWVLFALTLGTGTLAAQEKGIGKKALVQNGKKITCVESISNLTMKQVEAISKMETKHQSQIDNLREKMQSTNDFNEKKQIRNEMLENVVTHRSEVKKLLTENQQKEYDMHQLRGNNFGNHRAINRGRKGNSRGGGNHAAQGFAQGIRGNCNRVGYGKGNQQNNGNCRRFN